MTLKRHLYIFQNDLRVHDNEALVAACKECSHLMAVYIDDTASTEKLGWASHFWLSKSLLSLKEEIPSLLFYKGDLITQVCALVKKHNIDAVFMSKGTTPYTRIREESLAQALSCRLETHNTSLLIDPKRVLTKSGTPFKVFTPFWNTCLQEISHSAPKKRPHFPDFIEDEEALPIPIPTKKWEKEFSTDWEPGEKGAKKRLETFLQRAPRAYDTERDFPSIEGTSKLSPHLHFGEISPRAIWEACEGRNKYLSEIGWREFAYYLLFHFPYMVDRPFNPRFETFEWDTHPEFLEKWKRGMTGYPIIDAGMRELWATGWMHNRVRMIVASFLTKDLLIHWSEGANWFLDTLVDADIANNTAGWQWVAGCGADAAPYYRIFNPISQGEKFDPEGTYIRKWIPELRNMNIQWLHSPWEAPAAMRNNYPLPIVDHKQQRAEALKRFTLAELKDEKP